MKGRHITQEQVNQMNSLFWIEGMSAGSIAKIMEISAQCVYKYTKLDKRGNPPKPAGILTRNKKQKASRKNFFAAPRKEHKTILSGNSYSLNAREDSYNYVCQIAKSRNLSKVDAIDLIIKKAKRRCLFNW